MQHGLLRHSPLLLPRCVRRSLVNSVIWRNKSDDASLETPLDAAGGELGRVIKNDFAKFQEHYRTPKYPIVLAHGLLGFDELHLVGNYLPGVQYWRGIKDAYQKNGIEVITSKSWYTLLEPYRSRWD